MMRSQVKNSNVLVERPYQSKIIKRCKEKNSIVFLPTGAGKTLIAFETIKHFSHQLQKKYSEGGKRSIFLVKTIVLAHQQAKAAELAFTYEVKKLTGDDGVDDFKQEDWTKLLEENQIFVMTAQCFYNAGIRYNFINLEQVNVLIFDECHDTRKDHVYRQIMQNNGYKESDSSNTYMSSPKNMKNCRIIGLSGVLIGVSNKTTVERVGEELKQLEATLCSTIVTVNNLDDQKNCEIYATKPVESLEFFLKIPNVSCLFRIKEGLQKLVDKISPIVLGVKTSYIPKKRKDVPGYIKDLISLYEDIQYQINEMGAYGAYLTLLSVLIQLELMKRTGSSAKYRDIVKLGITKIEHFIHQMKLELEIDKKSTETILQNSSPKVQKLISYLQTTFNSNVEKELQCLIFTDRRSTAKALYHVIKYFGDYTIQENIHKFPLKADFVVGSNKKLPCDVENIISQSDGNAIKKFSEKKLNCLTCTDVLEEGIDLQMCNLVIMYDPPDTLRSYIQSRGRARDDKSKFVVFIEKGVIADKFDKQLKKWNLIHEEMKRQLIEKTIDREEPSEEEILEEQKQAWPPIKTKNGSTLTALNSINILNQYVQTIPTDRFTNSCGIDVREIDLSPIGFCVGIKLPITSSLQHEIVGDIYKKLKVAKQNAAFKTIEELYKLGELTESLTALDPIQKIELVENDYFNHWKKYSEDTKKAGTKKNLRFHPIKIPDLLIDSSPIISGRNYLYPISVKPKFETQNLEYLEVFKTLLGNGEGFGILTSKMLPRLCKMNLFPTYGKVECEVESQPSQISIESEDQLQKLRKFQNTIILDVLKEWTPLYLNDKTSLFIVPLDENKQIKWKLVENFQTLQKNQPRSFRANDYLNKIVSFQEVNYVVLKTELPLSVILNRWKTQEDSFYNADDFELCDDHKFSLVVKAISKNWNYLFPGGGGSGEKRNIEKRQNTQELNPESCQNLKFPADFWLKALLLPCILHRVNYLLLAEELRLRLINEGIDVGKARKKYELDVNYRNYDEHQKLISRNHSEMNPLESLPEEEFESALEESKATQTILRNIPSKAIINWDAEKLPIDFDRNWLTVTQEDIDFFSNFIDENSEAESKDQHLIPNQIQLVIKDPQNHENIKLLGLVAKKCIIQQKDLIKVITTSNAGDVFDMERFETLGDAFLKFIASLFLFKTHDKWHEGYLTELKGRLVSNRNLFYIGNDYGLSQYLKTTKLNESSSECVDLKPSSSLLCHSLTPNIKEQKISDKTIADSVEALLGCVISSLGVFPTLKLCGIMQILPNDEGKLEKLLVEKIPPRVLSQYSNENFTPISNRAKLEQKIGYNFEDERYLIQALTHASYPIKIAGTYEQLEFLGDAVLDFLITAYISEKCPSLDPGDLTDLRSALVNNATLACIVVRNDLHKFILYENHRLAETIKRFIIYQESVDHKVTDQIVFLECEDDSSAPAESVDIPKCLGDIFESLVGAIYLDSSMSLEKTWNIIYNLMKDELRQFMKEIPKQIVRRLYEFNKGSAKPKFYKVVEIPNDDGLLAVPLRIMCKGEEKLVLGIGKNTELARKAAAKCALNELHKEV